MVVLDARDQEINIDYYVRYINTGTIGQVIEIKIEDNDVGWIRIDKTGLWYLSDLVEVLDRKDLKITKKSDKNNKDIDINTIKNSNIDLEDVQLDSSVAEGGG